ncbi:hypothetical protein C8J57DRAFT_1339957 [Mycena rebaudengoi]|nr:hypothetical protein C8J57DRAFT_1339957 [Mycena rebaudengoi]
MRGLVRPLDGAPDIIGLHALQLISGADRLKASSLPPAEILVRRSEAPSDMRVESYASSGDSRGLAPLAPGASPNPDRARELIKAYLGVTFNIVTGDFGRRSVLKMAPEKILRSRVDSELEDFRRVTSSDKAQANSSSHIGGEVNVHAVAGAGFHHTRRSNTLSLDSHDDEVYDSRLLTQETHVTDFIPQLTPEFLKIIQQLPKWSIESPEPYRDFFSMHGTHVITRIAMGGHVRVVVHHHRNIRNAGSRREGGIGMSAPGLQPVGATARTSGGVSRNADSEHAKGREQFTILRSGGAAMAAELSNVLGEHFASVKRREYSCPWPLGEVRTRWMEALKDDPEFLRGHKTTQYLPFYGLAGLTKQQKADLKVAYLDYLGSKSKAKPPEDPSSHLPRHPGPRGPEEARIPREKNKRSITRAIKAFFSQVINPRSTSRPTV